MHFRTLLRATRPSFLILSPVCVSLGASTAVASQGTVDVTTLALVIFGALCAHVSVNTLNEYADFKSGLDHLTVKTPFSGGSGALPADPAMASSVLAAGAFTLFMTFAIGLYFLNSHGVLLLATGAIGIAIILTYTRWINRWPLLCLIAPGLGFGVLMVGGSHHVLADGLTASAALAALVPFFLVNNLLLLNQFPDIEADKRIGRKHLPIAYGTRISSMFYGVFAMLAYAVVIIGVWTGNFPRLSLIAVLPLILSVFALSGALKHGEDIGKHPQYLGANVAATLLTPALLSIAVALG